MLQQRKTRPRWPKGTYMKLRSGALLRTLMDENGKSLADVGRYAQVHRTFIWALTNPDKSHKRTCRPEVATRIAELLNVPLIVLFDVGMSTDAGRSDEHGLAAA